jgi:hypothetical protein
MDITKEEYFKLIDLYNYLGVGIFKKKFSFERKEICEMLGISTTNSISYNRFMQILKENNCISTTGSIDWKTRFTIDSGKLDRLIRDCEYFEKIKIFIFKSTNGLAEVGV